MPPMYELEDRVLFDGAAATDIDELLNESYEVDIDNDFEDSNQIDSNENENSTNATDTSDEVEENHKSNENSLDSSLLDFIGETTSESIQQPNILLVSTNINNYETLSNSANANTITIEYNPSDTELNDLFSSIKEKVGESEINNVAIATHGNDDGSFLLGKDELITSSSVTSDTEQQAFWNDIDSILSEDGRIDILSCNLASGDGIELINSLEKETDLNFAASDDDTGNIEQGGDWDLETDDINIKDEYFNEEKLAAFSDILSNATPTSSSVAFDVNQFERFVISNDNLLVTDSDSEDTLSIIITDLPEYGRLTYYDSNNLIWRDVVENEQISLEDINNSKLAFSSLNSNGSISIFNSDSFKYKAFDDSVYGSEQTITLNISTSTVTGEMVDSLPFQAGSEFLVNTLTSGEMTEPSVTGLSSGNYVVTWTRSVFSLDAKDIRAQVFDSNGTKVGNEIEVTDRWYDQVNPEVTSLSNGGFVITWQSFWQEGLFEANQGVYAKFYNANGSAVTGEVHINSTEAKNQQKPTVTELADGTVMFAWETNTDKARSREVYYDLWLPFVGTQTYSYTQNYTADDYDIKAQKFTSTGSSSGGEIYLSDPTPEVDQNLSQISGLNNGNFVTAWVSNDSEIQYQIFNSTGTAQIAAQAANYTTSAQQTNPSVTTLENGNFVISWQCDVKDGDNDAIVSRVFNSSGTALTSEILTNTYTSGKQSYPDITSLKDGGFIVSWTSRGQDGYSDGVFGQRFDANGNKVDKEFQINSYNMYSQNSSSVAFLENGNFVSVFESRNQNGIVGKIYSQVETDSYSIDNSKVLTGNLNNLYNVTGILDASSAEVSSGSISLNDDGSFTYTPNSSYSGLMRLRYSTYVNGAEVEHVQYIKVEDKHFEATQSNDIATIEISNISSVASLYSPDATTIIIDSLPSGGVLKDASLNTLQVGSEVSISDIENGNITFNSDNSLIQLYNTFTFTLSDGVTESTPYTFTIENTDINVIEDSASSENVFDLSSFHPGLSLYNNQSYISAENGTCTLDQDTGFVSYQPNLNFNGTETITYCLADDYGNPISEQELTFTVTSVNDLPTSPTLDTNINLDDLTSRIISLNDISYSDIENDEMTIIKITDVPKYGVLQYLDGDSWETINANDTITKEEIENSKLKFTASEDTNLIYSSDLFKYKVHDGTDFSEVVANVNIKVNDIQNAQSDPEEIQIDEATSTSSVESIKLDSGSSLYITTTENGAVAQIIDSNGNITTDTFELVIDENLNNLEINQLPNGNLITTWESDGIIYGQLLSPLGVKIGDPMSLVEDMYFSDPNADNYDIVIENSEFNIIYKSESEDEYILNSSTFDFNGNLTTNTELYTLEDSSTDIESYLDPVTGNLIIIENSEESGSSSKNYDIDTLDELSETTFSNYSNADNYNIIDSYTTPSGTIQATYITEIDGVTSIYTVITDSDGNAISTPTLIEELDSTYTEALESVKVTNTNGKKLITWVDTDESTSGESIYGQYMSLDGGFDGDEFKILSNSSGNDITSYDINVNDDGTLKATANYSGAILNTDIYENINFYSTSYTGVSGDLTLLEGDDVTYVDGSVSCDSGSITIDSNGAFDYTPTFDQIPGVHTITYSVINSDGEVEERSYTILFELPQEAPIFANPIVDQTATEDSEFSFIIPSNAFTDINDDIVSYSSGSVDSINWLNFDPTINRFYGIPTNDDVGTNIITITATDSEGNTTDGTFNLTITNTNDAPTLANSAANQTTSQNDNFSYPTNTLFSDVDVNDSLTFTTALTLPDGLSIDSDTGEISGTPTNDAVGTHTIAVIATDETGESISTSFTISIANVNDSPTILSVIPNQTVSEDSELYLTVLDGYFEDIDNDSLSLSADIPMDESWLTFDSSTGVLSGVPTSIDEQYSFNVTISATDPEGELSTQTLLIQVNPLNIAPTAQVVQAQQVNEDTNFFIDASTIFDDSEDGNSLTYTAYNLPSWLYLNSSSGMLDGTPTNTDVGHYSITIAATDTDGAIATTVFSLEVINTNDAPTLVSPNDTYTIPVAEGTNFIGSLASEFQDEDLGDSLSFSINSSDDISWLNFNTSTGEISGLTDYSMAGTYDLTVTATDESNLSVDKAVTIIVWNTNVAPTSESISSQTANQYDVFNIDTSNAFDDADNENLTYTAVGLPNSLSINSDTGIISGDLNSETEDLGVHRITVYATDGSDEIASSTFYLTVNNVNDAPTYQGGEYLQNVADYNEQIYVNYGIFNDQDQGDNLSYNLQESEVYSEDFSWLTLDANTRTVSGVVPDGFNVGTYNFDIIATDDLGLTSNFSFSITIESSNTLPGIVDSIADQTGTQGIDYTLDTSARFTTSADGGGLIYNVVGELPDGLTLDEDTGIISGTPTNDAVGTSTITIMATNPSNTNIYDYETFDIDIADVLDAPEAIGSTFTYIDHNSGNTIFDCSEYFRAPDGRALTYSINPSGNYIHHINAGDMSIDSETGILTINNNVESFDGAFYIFAHNDAGNVYKAFILNEFTPDSSGITYDSDYVLSNDITYSSGDTVDITIDENMFTIDTGATIWYDTVGLPDGLNCDSDTGKITGIIDSNVASGTYIITLKAIEDINGNTFNYQFAINIDGPNETPVGVLLDDVPVIEGQPINYKLPNESFTDPDGDSLTYSYTVSPTVTWLNFNETTNTFTGVPDFDSSGTYTVTVTASDGILDTSQTFDIIVDPGTPYPTTDYNTDFSPSLAESTDVVAIAIPDGLFSTENGASDLSYSVSGLPNGIIFDSGTNTFSGTPNSDGIYNVNITATNDSGNGKSVSRIFAWKVSNTNIAPAAIGAVSEYNIQEGQPFSHKIIIDNDFSDIDGDSLTYSFSVNPPASWLNIDSASNTLYGTPDYNHAEEYTVTLTATDPYGETASYNFDINVANTPAKVEIDHNITFAPSLSENKTVNEAIPTDLFTTTDTSSGLIYNVSGLPNGIYCSDSGELTGAPIPGSNGTYYVQITATNNDGEIATKTFKWVVDNVNDPPITNLEANMSATEGIPFNYTIPTNMFSDVDGDSLTLSVDSLPSWLSFDSDSNTFSGTPGYADSGSNTITITATDSSGAYTTGNLIIDTSNVNITPSINYSIEFNQSDLTEGITYNTTIPETMFNDIDSDDDIVYSSSGLPSGLTLNASTGVITGTPSPGTGGTHNVRITATNGDGLGESISRTFTWTVENVNDAPTTSIAINDQDVNEREALSFKIPNDAFTDLDNDDLSYTCDIPEELTWLSYDTNSSTFIGTPGPTDAGTYTLTITASDGEYSTDTTFNIVVANINQAPQINTNASINTQEVTEGIAFSYTIPSDIFTDIDNDSLNYSLSGSLPAGLSFNEDNNTISGTPENPTTSTFNVVITADDSNGGTCTRNIAFLVNNVNNAPELESSIPNVELETGDSFTYKIPNSIFNDIDVDDSVSLSVSGLPSSLVFNKLSNTIIGTVQQIDVGEHTIVVTGTDESGESTSTTFTIDISRASVPAPSLVKTIDNVLAVEDSELSATIPTDSFTSFDQLDSTLTYSISGLPSNLSFADGIITGIPSNDDVGSYTLTITATDVNNNSATEQITLTISNDNDTPTVNLDAIITPGFGVEDKEYLWNVPIHIFDDIDVGDTLSYSIDGLPDSLSFDASIMQVSGTALADDIGVHTISLTVADLSGETATVEFEIEIYSQNDAPSTTGSSINSSGEQGKGVNFDTSDLFEDSDISSAGDTLSYTATGLPTGLSIDPETGVISGTTSSYGSYTITITATDSFYKSVSVDLTITISPKLNIYKYDLVNLSDEMTNVVFKGSLDVEAININSIINDFVPFTDVDIEKLSYNKVISNETIETGNIITENQQQMDEPSNSVSNTSIKSTFEKLAGSDSVVASQSPAAAISQLGNTDSGVYTQLDTNISPKANIVDSMTSKLAEASNSIINTEVDGNTSSAGAYSSISKNSIFKTDVEKAADNMIEE